MTLSIDACSILKNLAQTIDSQPTYRRVNKTKPIYIFGAGQFGQSIAKVMQDQSIHVAGFIVTTPTHRNVAGLPVFNWDELLSQVPEKSDIQLAFGIFNREVPFNRLIDIINSYNIPSPLMPWELYDEFGDALGWKFWLSKRSQLTKHLDDIQFVHSKLEDRESQEILLNIYKFRLGLNLDFSSYQSKENQYFNKLTLQNLKNKEIIYLDCGAYNGDTYKDLIDHQEIICKQAFLFEPDPANYKNLIKNLHNKKLDALCLPVGVSKTYQSLSFSGDAGESGSISDKGNQHISTVALDEIFSLNTKVDLIKLDIEGAEADAFLGAKNIIKHHRPIIACSLYHRPDDLWQLPKILLDIHPDYKIYIRQHFFNSFESVLYAI